MAKDAKLLQYARLRPYDFRRGAANDLRNYDDQDRDINMTSCLLDHGMASIRGGILQSKMEYLDILKYRNDGILNPATASPSFP